MVVAVGRLGSADHLVQGAGGATVTVTVPTWGWRRGGAMGAVTTFGIVGTGWRSLFFVRLARLLPERLRVSGLVTRSAERAEQIATETGVPTHVSVADLLG